MMLYKAIIATFFLFNVSIDIAEEEIIVWNKNVKLKWTDYKAFLERDTPVAAASAVGIRYESITQSNERIILNVNAVFVKKKSGVWMEKATDDGLLHEQGHFDLAEIYARKMRNELQNFQFKYEYGKFKSDIIKVYNAYSDSLSLMHRMYDKDTHYSCLPVKQKEWNQYIKNELKQLEKYSKHFVTVYFKTD